MYKIFVFILAIAVISAALPVELESADGLTNNEGARFPRATCDLLSFSVGGVSAGHSLCAAHCIAMQKGYRGGRCIDGVCNCRK